MKKILFIVAIILAGQMVFGQAYFPTVDSGRKFTNRYIRNSAIEAFTNLRLNTVLNGMWQHIDSARLLGGGGGGGDNNYPNSLGFSAGTLTLGRQGLSSLTASINTSNVPEAGGVLFFTTARARLSLTGGTFVDYDNTSGVIDVDTTGMFDDFPTLSWNNGPAGYDSLVKWYPGSNEARIKALQVSATGVVLTKTETDTTLRYNLDFASSSKTYPNERAWGTIYEMNANLVNLGDFTTTGTAVISINSGNLRITSNTQDYTPRVIIRPDIGVGLPRWKMTIRYKIIVWNGSTNWFGPMIKSLVTHDGANFGYMGFNNVSSSGAGSSFMYDETGSSQLVSGGAGPSKSLNDIMEATLEKKDTILVYTIRNVTTASATQTLSYSFNPNNAIPLPNVGNWALMYNGAGGTLDVTYIKIESEEILSPNVLVVGHSKTSGGATSFAARFQNQLNATYPTVTYSAGTAERIDPDVYFKREALMKRNPEYVILADIWSNDKRAGLTVQQAIDNALKVEAYWKGGGTRVLWMPIPEDSTIGGANNLTDIRNWIAANRSADFIDVWSVLSTSNRLQAGYGTGDGVHINKAAHDLIATTIFNSGKLATISTARKTPFRTGSPEVQMVGDSLAFKFPWQAVANNVQRMNSNYELVKGTMYDNGTKVNFTAGVINSPPLANMTVNVDGPIFSYNTVAALYLGDRTTFANNFSFISNDDILRVGSSVFGNDFATFSSSGYMRLSTSVSGAYMSILQINRAISFNWVPSMGFGLQLADVTNNYTSSTAHTTAFYADIGQMTLTAAGSTSYTTAASFRIKGPVIAGTNTTIDTPLSLWVQAGISQFDGDLFPKRHIISLATLTSATAGAGAGTGPTLTVTGGDVSGKIELTTGSAPSTGGNIVTIAFLNAYTVAPNVVLTPGSSSAAALSGTSNPYVSSISTSQFVFTAGSVALAASTSYTWYYQVIQ